MQTAELIARPAGHALEELREMSLADAPDYSTAVAAGLAHGLRPKEALKSAFGKWLEDHADAVHSFGLANIENAEGWTHGAMVNNGAMVRFLCVVVAEQQRQIAKLGSRLVAAMGNDSLSEG